MKWTMDDPKEVVVTVYVYADTDEEAVNQVEEELNYLCKLDNPLLAFTLPEREN